MHVTGQVWVINGHSRRECYSLLSLSLSPAALVMLHAVVVFCTRGRKRQLECHSRRQTWYGMCVPPVTARVHTRRRGAALNSRDDLPVLSLLFPLFFFLSLLPPGVAGTRVGEILGIPLLLRWNVLVLRRIPRSSYTAPGGSTGDTATGHDQTTELLQIFEFSPLRENHTVCRCRPQGQPKGVSTT